MYNISCQSHFNIQSLYYDLHLMACVIVYHIMFSLTLLHIWEYHN